MIENLDGLRGKLRAEDIVSHFPLRTPDENPSQWTVNQHGAVAEMRNGGTVCLGRVKAGGGVLSRSFSSLV